MNINPTTQTHLFGLNSYLTSLIKLIDSNYLPNKIILSGPKGIGKSTLAHHFINYVFSKNEDFSYNVKTASINKLNRSYKLIENQSHPNFYRIDLIDEKKNIEINQIREMINYGNKSSFNAKPRFVLIDNLEYLNLNSLNALLKIVEEPNNNLFFILILNNNNRISDTLKSRCITFKINLSFEQSIEISNKLLNDSINKILHDDLINYYFTPGEIINLVHFAKSNNIDLKEYSLKKLLLLLIDKKYYTKDNFIKYYIFNIIQHYFLKLLHKSKRKKQILTLYNDFIRMNSNCSTFNLNYENLFMEFTSKVLNE